MPRTKEQFEDMRLNSKANIAATALRLFTSEGYHTTSISKIAKEAGVAIGLLYNYYAGKEDLLISIIDEHLQHIHENISKKLDEVSTQDINEVIEILIETIIQKEDSWKLIISVMFQPAVSNIAKERIHKAFQHQEEIFENYFKEKKVDNPEESARVLNAVLHGALLQFACTGNVDDLKLIQNTVVSNLLKTGI